MGPMDVDETFRLGTLWPEAVLHICSFLSVQAILAFSQSNKWINSICTSKELWMPRTLNRWSSISTRKDQVDGWRDLFMRRFLFEEVWIAGQTRANPPVTPTRAGHYCSVRTLGQHTGGVHSIDSRGTWVASASSDKSIRLWDRTGRRPALRLESHGDAVKCVRFNRYDKNTNVRTLVTMLSCSNDKTVRIWSYSDVSGLMADVHIFRGHTEKVSGVDFCSSTTAVSGGWDKTIVYWDLEAKKSIRKIPAAGITTFITGNGHQAVTSTRDKFVRVWDLRSKTAAPVLNLKGHTEPITAHHTDSQWIVSGGEDSMVRWWDLRKPDPFASASGREKIGGIFFDDAVCIAACWNGDVIFYNMYQPGRTICTLKDHNSQIDAVSVNRMSMFTGGTDKAVKCWDFHRMAPSDVLQGH